jgi:MOSC domain-containing protein YiiM
VLFYFGIRHDTANRKNIWEAGKWVLGMKGKVVSINVSDKKGVRKKPVREAMIKTGFGIEGDAHASSKWHRQVSLLALESIRKMQEMGLKVNPGDFAENITTEGIDLVKLPVGTKMIIGCDIEVEVSQIGKVCHTRCEIYRQAGDCIMPKEGIFVKVLMGGKVKEGDEIVVGIK